MFDAFRKVFPESRLVRDVDRARELISAGELTEAEAVMRRPAISWGNYRDISSAVMDTKNTRVYAWYLGLRCRFWPRPYEIVRAAITRNFGYLMFTFPHRSGEWALFCCTDMFVSGRVPHYSGDLVRRSPGSWLIPWRVRVSPGRVETLRLFSPRDNRSDEEWKADPSLEFGWLLGRVMLRYVAAVHRDLLKSKSIQNARVGKAESESEPESNSNSKSNPESNPALRLR